MPSSMAGHYSVDASAARLRHYRYAVERVMRAMAGWIALTPELSAKLVLGRHVWDNAQHADLLGGRLLELRAHGQESQAAGAGVAAALDAIESPERPGETIERFVGVYRVFKPHLLGLYREHLSRANAVYEPPTRRILERCIADESRHVGAGEAALARLVTGPEAEARARAWQARVERLLADAGGVAGDGMPAPGAPDGPEAQRGRAEAEEFVRLEAGSSAGALPPALAAAVAGLGRALVAGDRARAASFAADGPALDAVLAAGPPLPGLTAHRVVACARIGARRVVKLRLEGPSVAATLLLRWADGPSGWRVELAEIIGAELPRPA